MRYDARADANQAQLVAVMRQTGYTVTHLHRVGGGVPDLLVSGGALGDRNVLIEVKTPAGTLTGPERAFFRDWPGEKHIIRTIEDWVRLHNTWNSS
jgi:hypothetical protein